MAMVYPEVFPFIEGTKIPKACQTDLIACSADLTDLSRRQEKDPYKSLITRGSDLHKQAIISDY
jgi:hypothetical protein